MTYKCYLYGVFGQAGTGGVDLLMAQLFSSESATIFGVPANALLVLLRTSTGASYGDAHESMLKSLEYDSFPEPWMSKIRYYLRSDIAQRAGRQAWSDLYDRDHFEGKFAIPAVAATPAVEREPEILVGTTVAHIYSRTLRGVVVAIENGLYTVRWYRSPSSRPFVNSYALSRLEFVAARNHLSTFNPGDFVNHVTNKSLTYGIVSEVLESWPPQYKVNWGCFSEEKTHDAEDLKPAPEHDTQYK